MTRIELLDFLTNRTKDYREQTDSISRNKHLTGMAEQPSPEVVDAVLVDFINYVGYKLGVDYALSVKDLDKKIGDNMV